MRRYTKRIKEMPLNMIMKKIKSRLINIIYYKVREFKVKREPIDIKDLIFEGYKSEIPFFFDAENKEYYIMELTKHSAKKKIMKQADKICEHIFNLLGSGETYLGNNITWNQDFKSGFKWENKFYKTIKTIDLSNNADVKVPWELSRFQHISVLGQAYWITADEKYAMEFQNQVQDWIENNPIEMSVNWTCTMDVAIRACNWVIGIKYFEESKIDSQFWVKINKWLYMHGDFIYNNLEKWEHSNNHYLSNLVGLIWLGLYFENLGYEKNNANVWLKHGINELEIEIKRQVYEDGFNYEASTAYHCMVTEFLLYTSILCKYNEIYFSKSYEEKLEKMCEVIMNITKPNGLIPLIGDFDSGRFVMFTGYGDTEMRDFRYLLGVAGEHFNRDDFRYHSSNQLASLWMFKNLKEIPKNKYALRSISYSHGGVHILRNEKVYLIVRCGQNGNDGNGGHSHNDQLSFELNIDGEDFIVDPGTYTYTSDYKMRNFFRSTAQHNTLQINNLEQNRFEEKNLFELENQTDARLLEFSNNTFKGIHYGYLQKIGLNHTRSIELVDDKVIIKDKLAYDEKHKGESIKITGTIIFNSKVSIDNENKCINASSNKTKSCLYLDNNIELLDTYVSYKYGELTPTKKMNYNVKEKVSILEIKYNN